MQDGLGHLPNGMPLFINNCKDVLEATSVTNDGEIDRLT